MFKLPNDFDNLPAIPADIGDAIESLAKLGGRELQTQQSEQSMSNLYTIDNTTATGYNFTFGKDLRTNGNDRDDMAKELTGGDNKLLLSLMSDHIFGPKEESSWFSRFVGGIVDKITGDDDEDEKDEGQPLTLLSLEKAEQYSMSWATLPDVYHSSRELLPKFVATLEDADAATAAFWPTISEYGMPYDLLIAQKLGSSTLPDPRAEFVSVWKPEWDALVQKGLLYAIDMTIFDHFKPREVDGLLRFTPGTVTLLEQNPQTKELTPIAVRVAGYEGANKQIYVRGQATPSAWLYALQAAKTSITVYGIWLGHVYQWHIVTAAMQFTMYESFSEDHQLYKFLEPMSQYLIGFDTVLLVLWRAVAPPTAIDTPRRFLKLCDRYADGRNYFDDDPTAQLKHLGIDKGDFTDKEDWDRYQFVPNLLKVWDIVGNYCKSFVDASYADNKAIQDDKELQKWIELSGDSGHDGGNVRGLPKMNSKDALTRVLQSLIYRVTVHGSSRLSTAANPGLSFVGNYPPCLQNDTIPAPDSTMTNEELMRFMPATGTIGGMVVFYFTFSFSVPYKPLIPIAGFDEDLFFDGGATDPRNLALIRFRKAIAEFIGEYSPVSPTLYQWPLNIET